MKRAPDEKSAARETYTLEIARHEKSATRKKCNMKIVPHEKSDRVKFRKIVQEQCTRMH